MSLRVHTFTLQFKLQPAFRSLTRSASSKPWKVTGLNHIALVTPNMAKTCQFYRDTFGIEVDEPFTVPLHSVDVSFVHMGNTRIEVDDLEAAIQGLKAKGMKFMTEETKIGACGVPIIFFDPNDSEGAVIELEQAQIEK